MTRPPTILQYELIIKFMEKNVDIARGNVHSSQGKADMKKRWQKLTNNLNSIENGAVKDTKAWMRFWTNKKYYIRRIKAQKALGSDTGDESQQLSPLDEKVLTILDDKSSSQDPLNVSVKQETKNQNDDDDDDNSRLSDMSSGSELLFKYTPAGNNQSENHSQGQSHSHRQSDDNDRAGHKQSRSHWRPLRQSQAQRSPVSLGHKGRSERHGERTERLIALQERKVEAELQTAESLRLIANAIVEMKELIAIYLRGQNLMPQNNGESSS